MLSAFFIFKSTCLRCAAFNKIYDKSIKLHYKEGVPPKHFYDPFDRQLCFI